MNVHDPIEPVSPTSPLNDDVNANGKRGAVDKDTAIQSGLKRTKDVAGSLGRGTRSADTAWERNLDTLSGKASAFPQRLRLTSSSQREVPALAERQCH